MLLLNLLVSKMHRLVNVPIHCLILDTVGMGVKAAMELLWPHSYA